MHQSYTLTRVTRKVTHKSYPRTELPAKLHIRVIREQSYPQSYTHELPPNTSYTKVIQKLPANHDFRAELWVKLPDKLQIRVTRKQSYPQSYK